MVRPPSSFRLQILSFCRRFILAFLRPHYCFCWYGQERMALARMQSTLLPQTRLWSFFSFGLSFSFSFSCFAFAFSLKWIWFRGSWTLAFSGVGLLCPLPETALFFIFWSSHLFLSLSNRHCCSVVSCASLGRGIRPLFRLLKILNPRIKILGFDKRFSWVF